MDIRIDDLRGTAIKNLLTEHLEDMRRLSPPESVHALDLEALRQPNIAFWCAWDGTELAGCGALKALNESEGEIKSMRTAKAYLGQGVGRKVLEQIMAQARQRNYHRLLLETGPADTFGAAHALYIANGFVECPPFADYTLDPFSVYMVKNLL